MLVLSRKTDEALIIGEGEIRIVILGVQGDQVKLGIEAPRAVSVMREELFRAQKENALAAHSVSPDDLSDLKAPAPVPPSPSPKPKSP
ncbi:MAG: carbon storage regulator [Sulfobacillus thermosulfidooxidans]|uniref:Translational regulator CsrA n=1 Tax=Sulfobacillus thermotolerans TaxID=338644 RepID=A0ABM6RUH5_9FIRM|nr:carbon storage regulator CsrA [Sulfobacillus sp. hq2]AUW94958.1 carbon storage regulator [Sulfobacillus thermotolerans]MCY0908207.1 carbon storage regulator CsrA [Sulfobacillus thermotolerans]POB10440.1 carbon storage regulator [Sulfobacillus sp. hq2]PSR36609.1 MAG: carbon storage regulator [Sulfobacillus thermosulfidooxidans]